MKRNSHRAKRNWKWPISFFFLFLLSLAAIWWWWQKGGSLDSLLTPPQKEWVKYESQDEVFGLRVKIEVFAQGNKDVKTILQKTFSTGKKIEKHCNPWLPESDITKLNNTTSQKGVTLSQNFIALLEQAYDLAEITDGLYNPAMGSLHALWKARLNEDSLPSSKDIKEILPTCNWKNLQINPVNNKAFWLREGTSIELRGIAIGYAFDEMYHILETNGLPHAMIYTQDAARIGLPPPGKKNWHLPLLQQDKGIKNLLPLKQCAFFTARSDWLGQDSEPYALNSKTGMPPKEKTIFTIIASHGRIAQPLAYMGAANRIDPLHPQVPFKNLPRIAWKYSYISTQKQEKLQSPNFPMSDITPTLTP